MCAPDSGLGFALLKLKIDMNYTESTALAQNYPEFDS